MYIRQSVLNWCKKWDLWKECIDKSVQNHMLKKSEITSENAWNVAIFGWACEVLTWLGSVKALTLSWENFKHVLPASLIQLHQMLRVNFLFWSFQLHSYHTTCSSNIQSTLEIRTRPKLNFVLNFVPDRCIRWWRSFTSKVKFVLMAVQAWLANNLWSTVPRCLQCCGIPFSDNYGWCGISLRLLACVVRRFSV